MIGSGAGPDQTGALQPLPKDAGILGNSPVYLGQNACSIMIIELKPQGPGHIADYIPVGAGLSRRLNGFMAPLHPPLRIGEASLLLRPDRSGQNNIRQLGCGGHEYILHH